MQFPYNLMRESCGLSGATVNVFLDVPLSKTVENRSCLNFVHSCLNFFDGALAGASRRGGCRFAQNLELFALNLELAEAVGPSRSRWEERVRRQVFERA